MRKVLFYLSLALFYIPVVIPADGAVSRTNPDNKNVVAKTNRSLSRVVQESKNGQNQNVNHSVVSRSVRNNVSERQNTAVVSRSGEKARNMSSRNADKITNRRDNVSKTETNKVFGARNVGIISRPVNSKDGTENILDKKITIRAAQKQLGTAAEITKAKEILEQTAELNKSCQEQYNECMDQFCAVVDAQQKRCSCSANLSKYTKVEEAVNNANTSLNEVAQRIRYVGLSADEIRAIMNATEAEEALDDNKDKSETRDMLNDIEKMIQDPTISASYTAENDTLNLLDIDFSEDSTDIFNLDFLGAESSNISNKRGKSLYDVAVKRCKTILNNCENVGATSDQITGNYDLAIDKDCIAYEQGLKKMNEKLLSNVRSANSMLQKARLTVMQNKTQYNMTECVGALENCMKDEMVCGDNYFKCIDPTKKYIDENGDCEEPDNFYPLTAVMNDKIVGSMIIRRIAPGTMRFGFVIIDDSMRGKGIGKKMVLLAKKYAFEILGAKKITMGVFDNNPGAYYCYKAVGFKEIPMDRDIIFNVFGEEWKIVEMDSDSTEQV